ncbi:MAG TPA: FkbM family methyltransferase [Chitinophagaceae bacterium]|nr:FkbM family methyltransferase [Chitinophagaceae bacterium]
MGLITAKMKQGWEAITSRRYWEWVWLYFRYYRKKTSRPFPVRFLGYRLEILDGASFVYQYKDIFFREEYRFLSGHGNPVIVDCGANIGMSCIYFKRRYPGAVIQAVEADPEIAGLLSRNLRENGFADVEVLSKAVWTDDRGVIFKPDGADGGHIAGQESGAAIPSISLAELIGKYPRVDLLKMDIEGEEGKVLKACGPALNRVQQIIVEYHSRVEKPQDLGGILTLLESLGFRYLVLPVTRKEQPLSDGMPPGGEMDLQLNIFARKQP